MTRKINRCSKDYINCRLHPESSLSTPIRVKVRTSQTHEAAKTSFIELNTLVDESELNTEELEELKERRYQAALMYHATLPDSHYKKTRTLLTGETVTNEQRSYLNKLRRNVQQDHYEEIQRDALYEKEQAPLSEFEQAVSSALIAEGEFRRLNMPNNDETENGFTVGEEVNQHFVECGVRKVHSYDENHPSATDPSGRELKGVISCNCGRNYKESVFVPNNNGEFLSNMALR